MKKLIVNIFIFGSPLLFCLAFFAIDDPFGILYKNECLAATSEDMMVIRKYINERGNNHYSSFIFGNSRTHAFKNYKCGQNSPQPLFDFGCPGESVLNIKKKLELVIAKQSNIQNVLILIDDGILENTDNSHRFYQGPVYNHTPLSSNVSHIAFYTNYIKYYFNNYFFLKHIYYKLTGNYKREWMEDAFTEPGPDMNYKCSAYPTLADSLLQTNFTEYKKVFKPDYMSYPPKELAIDERDIAHLNDIKQLLDKNKINYRIIYPPNFHKRKIEPKLERFLFGVFKTNFYDFSGINKITTDSTLNYENLHFTYMAANMMMDSICIKN